MNQFERHISAKPGNKARVLGACLLFGTFGLTACGDTSAANEPRNRIMGTGEKTNIAPLTADDQFLEAVRRGKLARVKIRLARGANIAARDGLQSSALLLAVRGNHGMELIRFIMKQGAGVPGFVDLPDSRGRTPLSWAAQYDRIPAMKFLLAHGAATDRPDKGGRTPLFHAALAGREKALRLLLKSGANPNQRDTYGDTPLIMAGVKKRAKIIPILLAGGADRAIRNQEGKTAQERARDPRIKKLLR